MPTYSYRCTECGTAFDIQQAFTDDSLTVCPQTIDGRPCGGKLRKLFSAVGVSFTGSGFYRNDSRPAPKAESGSSESPKSESSKSESSKPAETAKPAAASTSASSSAPAKSAAPVTKE